MHYAQLQGVAAVGRNTSSTTDTWDWQNRSGSCRDCDSGGCSWSRIFPLGERCEEHNELHKFERHQHKFYQQQRYNRAHQHYDNHNNI